MFMLLHRVALLGVQMLDRIRAWFAGPSRALVEARANVARIEAATLRIEAAAARIESAAVLLAITDLGEADAAALRRVRSGLGRIEVAANAARAELPATLL